MKKGDRVAIVCCSNGQHKTYRHKLDLLHETLSSIGLNPVFSDYIYEKNSIFSGSGKERAKSLMDFYRDESIKVIFDISGGDIANEVLSYLDFEVIEQCKKQFWGYSDLTTIINAIYAKTGKSSVLYQIRNLIYEDRKNQLYNFTNTVMKGSNDLFTFNYEFVQKEGMRGTVVGGNIRCLLKLAGTQYWPDMNKKILLLESFGGDVPQMVTYFNQLKHIGVFDEVNGILLGTFTKMQQELIVPSVVDLLKWYTGNEIPIAITREIGHGTDSKGIVIGEEIIL